SARRACSDSMREAVSSRCGRRPHPRPRVPRAAATPRATPGGATSRPAGGGGPEGSAGGGETEGGGGPDTTRGVRARHGEGVTGGDRTITGQAFVDAKNHLTAMAAAQAKQSGRNGTRDAGLWSWDWLGPQNIGGRTLAILFDPNDSNHLWAGGASGGISVSTD